MPTPPDNPKDERPGKPSWTTRIFMGACIVIWSSYLVYQFQRDRAADREQRGRASLEWYWEMEAEKARERNDFWRDFHPDALDTIENLEKAMAALNSVTGIPPGKLTEFLEANPGAVILDIRSPEQFADACIPGATNRDWNREDFKDSLRDIDKSAPWVVYDQSGEYENGVFKSIVEAGAFDLYRLEGGFQEFQLDQAGFGADRSGFLRRLAADSEKVVLGPAGAFGMIRRGERAFYLGPVMAGAPESGEMIVKALLSGIHGRPVFWDLPEGNQSAVALAESMGFTRQRELIRMWAGPAFLPGSPSIQWAISGPETG